MHPQSKTLCIILLLLISVTLSSAFSPWSRKARVDLYQSDFINGTYRILESGEYHIREDIEFGPRPDNDYWNDPRDRHYPIGNYYLGFFAAITIEVDDVELYFHGHTLQQSKEFYLLQRFFNVIQLNDKVFVHNEGVSSLNYQNRDNVTYDDNTHTVGDLVTVKNIRIQGGTIGRNSHIGIHGNGARQVTIKDMTIKEFEVAGIQCNGCQRVVIDRCTVGPASQEVPALATFSNARFLDLFANRLIPAGFTYDTAFSAELLPLLEEEITFADRDEPVTIQETFDRLDQAIRLYRNYILDTLPALTPAEEELLEEAKKVFSNPSGITDGGVLNGIIISKLGVPHPDDNFYGSGYESGNVIIQDTEIKGLHARPVDVPALQTINGDFIQGTSRDVFRIFDVVSDQFRTLTDSYYQGNFLSDVYISLWKLSNSFYRTRVYDSPCGNFGSNATVPYDILPGHADQCLGGINRDPTLTGRKVTLFQKRYFGGLVLTQGVYDWATTKGKPLDDILASPVDAPSLRSQKHLITCGIDTMFHPLQGVIGIKILESNRVVLKRVQIHDLVNKADRNVWVCDQKWKRTQNGEMVKPNNFAITEPEGSFIKGVIVLSSDNIKFDRVEIEDLNSDEGDVFGIKVMDDVVDRTDYANGRGITFEQSSIKNLRSGGKTKSFDLTGTEVSPSRGLTIGEYEELGNSFVNPKTSIIYGFSGVLHPDAFNSPGIYDTGRDIFEFATQVSKFKTLDQLLAFRNKGLKYFETYFGMHLSDYLNTPLNESITVYHDDGVTPSDTQIFWFAYETQMKYHPLSFCHEDSCSDLLSDSLLLDIGFTAFVGSEGLTFHGTFAGDEGQFAPQGSYVFSGFYSFENVEVNGVVHNNVEIEYFPACPITASRFSADGFEKQMTIVNCELESPLFGKGVATGSGVYTKVNETHWEANGYNVMVFDDIIDFPVEGEAATSIGANTTYNFPSKLFSVWADGVLPARDESFKIFPLTKPYHFTDESAIRYLTEHTSYNTKAKQLALRKRFLTRLRDEFGVAGVNPDGFDDIEVDAIVDLGGGNHLTAYEVNDVAMLRILSQVDGEAGTASTLPVGSRIREAGFRLVLGRAGRDTKFGHLPQGTTFTEGVYILENTEYYGSRIELDFYNNEPIVADTWASSIIDNHIESTIYGSGTALLAVTAPKKHPKGMKINIRGSFYFD